MKPIYVGTAGWSIPKSYAEAFSGKGTHLERYARRLFAVEVNSSFYRDHQEATYDRWRYTTPDDFRFSVKLPRKFSHLGRLEMPVAELTPFLESVRGLGEKLGVLLVQLPPKLAYEEKIAHAFFSGLRERFTAPIALEPRHPSWGQEAAFPLYEKMRISKVQADPEPCPAAHEGFRSAGGIAYHRLHGSPEIYRSAYDESFLSQMAETLKSTPGWCIFDNTTLGHSAANALYLSGLVNKERQGHGGDERAA